MKHKKTFKLTCIYLLYSTIMVAQADLVEKTILISNNESLHCILISANSCSYVTVQRYHDVQQNLSDIYSCKLSCKPDLLIWHVLDQNKLLIGYFINDNENTALIFDLNGKFNMLPVTDYSTRSCFEYANPITRTFDQLNVRRCMRVGGDLIVCGKIITDPVCTVTPCATQIER